MDTHETEGIANRAFHFWEKRGRPLGSPEVDWSRAEPELENQRHAMPYLLGIALEPGWV
jgi:Protein of unknown function (DUF2934)